MTYEEAKDYKQQFLHLIGTLSKGGTIYCIAIVPSDVKRQKDFLRTFMSNGYNADMAIIPYSNSDVEVWSLSGKEYLLSSNVLFYNVLKK